MSFLISMLAGAAVLWWFAKGPGRLSVQVLSPFTRMVLGAALGVAGLLLALRARFDLAIVLFSASAFLLGVRLPALFDPVGQAQRARLRTLYLDAQIDTLTGEIEAKLLGGPLAGRYLSSLNLAEGRLLAQELAREDRAGLALVLDDLDRRFPGWRADLDLNAQAGNSETMPFDGQMSLKQAHEILGVSPQATEEAIRAAHRALIARVHPDKGGSSALAALINRAKDVALGAR